MVWYHDSEKNPVSVNPRDKRVFYRKKAVVVRWYSHLGAKNEAHVRHPVRMCQWRMPVMVIVAMLTMTMLLSKD
jgi:hypothetical protein